MYFWTFIRFAFIILGSDMDSPPVVDCNPITCFATGMIFILRARNGLELNQAFSGTSCFSDWRIWSLILWKRSMGATDMFYRLFWCFSGATSTSASQSTGSQHHSLVVAPPSGPTSCWLGFLSGSSNQRGTTTRIGNDTAEIPGNPDTSSRLSSHKSKIYYSSLTIY